MKSIVLTLIIVATLTADVMGVSIGLDAEHYIGLLVADIVVWATPNKGYVNPDKKKAVTTNSTEE